jgi:hypothetical protein
MTLHEGPKEVLARVLHPSATISQCLTHRVLQIVLSMTTVITLEASMVALAIQTQVPWHYQSSIIAYGVWYYNGHLRYAPNLLRMPSYMHYDTSSYVGASAM